MSSSIKPWTIYGQSRSDTATRQKLFDNIWRIYHKRLFFFIRNIVQNEAEDLLQEIMMKIYQNLQKYNPFYSFNTWIYAIARNHCINFLNKRKLAIQSMDIVGENIPSETGNITPEKQLIDKEISVQIEGALSGFESEFREIAYLRFYEGLTCQNIAKIMKLPNGTVKSRLHTMRHKIKKALEKYNEA
jgi:RNA polymerase sigma factor (sigma-70 family)